MPYKAFYREVFIGFEPVFLLTFNERQKGALVLPGKGLRRKPPEVKRLNCYDNNYLFLLEIDLLKYFINEFGKRQMEILLRKG